ncbi:MAG: HEPN domain-containing protein [Lachnospiraceae bacterium]|nr:HEPN domain-containing protein [Lachnospiraceae bacterium]
MGGGTPVLQKRPKGGNRTLENSIKELVYDRLEREKEMLNASGENLKIHQYRTSLNRSYYAVFHGMRAVNVLEGFDSSKHSGVIAYFNRSFLKEGKLNRDLYQIIKAISYLREKSDYDDFYIAGKQEAEEQLKSVRFFVASVEEYLKSV